MDKFIPVEIARRYMIEEISRNADPETLLTWFKAIAGSPADLVRGEYGPLFTFEGSRESLELVRRMADETRP